MICSNSLYHGDEDEIEFEYRRIQELKDMEYAEQIDDE